MPDEGSSPDWVRIGEIADRLDVRPTTVDQWRFRHDDFPQPDVFMDPPVWTWGVVEAWARSTGRLPVAEGGEGLLGARELAPMLGVAKRTFDLWASKPGFPEPDGLLKRPGGGYRAAGWRVETIGKWAAAEGRPFDTTEEQGT